MQVLHLRRPLLGLRLHLLVLSHYLSDLVLGRLVDLVQLLVGMFDFTKLRLALFVFLGKSLLRMGQLLQIVEHGLVVTHELVVLLVLLRQVAL